MIHRPIQSFALTFLFLTHLALADNWPQWRGPTGNSVSAERGLPVVWNAERGIIWKTELPEWGTSTPCIWGDAIFVTADQEGKLLLIKLNKQDGKKLWTKEIGAGEAKRMPLRAKSDDERREQRFHQLHNLASPSPVTNGKVVVVHFGNGDLAAFDFDGNPQWQRNLQQDFGTYTVWWGHANSPVLFENMVISTCLQDSLEGIADPLIESYVVAHDLDTGRQKWKAPRMTGAKAEKNDAYTTPLLYESDEGPRLVVMGGNQLDAYDPRTGEQLWYLPNIVGGRTVSGPTYANGLIYVTQGKAGPLLAVKAGGKGEISRDAIQWRHEQGTPDTCCPVAWEDLLFTITDRGVARCYDATTGHLKWTERVPGDYKASPLAAEGRIYFLNTAGLCTVVSASPRFHRLAENQIDGDTIASPAVSDGRIYFRARNALYCVGKK